MGAAVTKPTMEFAEAMARLERFFNEHEGANDSVFIWTEHCAASTLKGPKPICARADSKDNTYPGFKLTSYGVRVFKFKERFGNWPPIKLMEEL